MRSVGRGATAALTIVAVLSVGASAAASPGSSATTGSAAAASTHSGKHPVTGQSARITREHRVPQSNSPAVQSARTWAAEDPYSRFVCYAADGAVATAGVVDRVDPSRPLTADERQRLCRLGFPGSSP